MAFLTIITRSFRRPQSLGRCVLSVASQTDPDIEQIIVHDPEGRGIEWSYLNLRNVKPTGEYVFLLDDDDYLVNMTFVEALKECAEQNGRPDVIYVGMNVSGTLMPDFSDGLRKGWIACSCFAVKRSVWLEHVADFKDDYSSDFYFIQSVDQCYKAHSKAQLNMIASKVGKVSHGQPENVAAFA